MIILHDQDTLLHETLELLGSKLRPALESSARIKAIVEAIDASQLHELRTITADDFHQTAALELAKATHDANYLSHVQHVFDQWLEEGLIENHETVLPECFRLHNMAHDKLSPPKDTFARAGYYAFDMSTGISQHSWKAIIASANLAVQAAQLLLPLSPSSTPLTTGNYVDTVSTSDPVKSTSTCETISSSFSDQPRTVLALTRPPGHHCTPDQAGGYCYINNVAVAVTTLRHFYPPSQRHQRATNPQSSSTSKLKIAILDLDFHHGNGTQEIFYTDPCVLYVSIHGEDEFPYYTGSASERGPSEDHPAWDKNLNLPLPTGCPFVQYLETLQIALEAVQRHRPDYLLVSLGFDTFHLDPLGKFQIQTEDYAVMAKTVRSEIKNLPAAILLEGGYVIDRLGDNLLSFLRGWEDAEIS